MEIFYNFFRPVDNFYKNKTTTPVLSSSPLIASRFRDSPLCASTRCGQSKIERSPGLCLAPRTRASPR